MSRKSFHIVLVLCMIWNVLYSQQFTNYNIKDGLPSNHVYRITQDNEGFVWIITDNGIAKFNGKEFKIFNTSDGLPTNDIWGVQVTPDNNIWFFSKAKKLGYIKNDSVYAFPRENSNEILFPASYYQFNNDFILYFNQDLVFLNENDKWDRIDLLGNEIKATSTASNRLIRNFMNDNKIRSSFLDNSDFNLKKYRDIVVDRKIYWYQDDEYGVYDLESREPFNRRLKLKRNLENYNFTRFHFVNDEIQLTGSGFVSRLDREFNMKDVIELPEEIQSHFSMIDRSGNVWMATNNNGVYKIPSNKLDCQYHLTNEIIQSIDLIGEDVITSVYDKGFYKYERDNKRFEPFISRNGFIYRAVQIDQLGLGFYIFGNLIEIRNISDNQLVKRINSNNWARRLVYHDGFLYGSVTSGLNKIDPTTFEVVHKYSLVGINDMETFKGELIVATSTGLKKRTGEDFIDVQYEDSLMDHPVSKLDIVNDSLLLASTNGFGAYFTNLVEYEMLERTDFLSIHDVIIGDNNIWLGTSSGVLYFKKSDSRFELIDKIDDKNGLLVKSVSSIALLDDEIMVGSNNGIAMVPFEISQQEQLLEIYISEVRHNNLMSKEDFSNPFNKGNTTTFSIRAIDFSEGNPQFNYEYRLIPSQMEWTSTTSESISFSDLGPDKYTLEIRSGQNESSMDFEITPLWWQTTFSKIVFVLISVGIVLLILLLIRKYELNRKTKQLKTQKKITEFKLHALRSQMNPHFVFNSLAAIQYYINNNEVETSEKYLVKFSKLIRQFFELSKEKDISLEKEIELLKNYLDIEQFRFKERMNYEIFVDEKINTEKTIIPTMLLQPIIENAVNHGIFNKENPGTVTLNFKYIGPNETEVRITDDGVGIGNTKKKLNGAVNSSNVLNDRIFHLNRSGNWDISYSIKDAYPHKSDKGTVATFIIKNKM